MRLTDSFPILVVDDELSDPTAAGRVTQALIEIFRKDGTPVIIASDLQDAEQIIRSDSRLSALVLDWDAHHSPLPAFRSAATSVLEAPAHGGRARMVQLIRERFPTLPIMLLADQTTVDHVPQDVLRHVAGYVWKLEDTPDFVAARVEELRREYLDSLLPPFFSELVEFVQDARYSWHTPGHSGGAAFLKAPAGAAFHTFFGENTLRSDLSVSVGELGSLLEHTGPVGAAEAEAARVFGADRTMFVTNGTSTANKIAFHSCVAPGDVVLVDRNCHKSIMHAIVMTGAIPVYLRPTRNAYGIIGPIPTGELDRDALKTRIAAHPLVADDHREPVLAVITNSTYDGLCYDADNVLRLLGDTTRRVLFDEAWFGYAHFHPLYAHRHAMGIRRQSGQPAIFATQSTHKLLAAFSQGSMLHLHDPDGVVAPAALEEAFMMHTSTSPQYGIIASLDVSARMMEGPQGTALIGEAIEEANAFRCELSTVAQSAASDDWAFQVWQPAHALEAPDSEEAWVLREGESWHGYPHAGDGHAMLDPIKVTILTPGIDGGGRPAMQGIPAGVVSHFLDERGIVVEKTGLYSFLVLFSLGVTKGKAGTLLTELLEFKRLYDERTPLRATLPRLVAAHPERYSQLTLRQLSSQFHEELTAARMTALSDAMYSELPEPVTTPAVAYRHLVSGCVDMVPVSELEGRVSAAMVVPYPPGIPVIMPGERFGAADGNLLRYLAESERLAKRFPGFETEIHGVHIEPDGSYRLPCLSVSNPDDERAVD